MIQITQLKLPIPHSREQLEEKIARTLGIRPTEIESYEIVRRSVDARKREGLHYVYSLWVKTSREKKILAKSKHKNIMSINPVRYRFPDPGEQVLEHPPVVVGSGPAGLFCGYMLAKHGYRPLILERGDSARERQDKVEHFWKTGILDPSSNVQFGEGGAGTFSDGKLNTGVKDKAGRNQEVLRIFVEAGAPEDILYDARPHLGTDLLIQIVETMRRQIQAMGGSFRFRTQATDLILRQNRLRGLILNGEEELPAEAVILALGHSARDTFQMLYRRGICMEAKSFAAGVRVEHPQEMITRSQYGEHVPEELKAASYRLAQNLDNGRGVYSFCMCPGGWVVNASSEPGFLAVNGMSYRARGGPNANSAIVVTVTPEDYAPYNQEGLPEALSGMAFQRYLEKMAFKAARGRIPVQRFEDFCRNRQGGAGGFPPCIKGGYSYENVRNLLPEFIGDSLEAGIRAMDAQISGFAMGDALLSAVESRTSSPVRICRNEFLESNIPGLYPCGEGAGYAGGITSAAMDGIRCAEAVGKKFVNFR